MLHYEVRFVKNLLDENGKAFKCVQGVIEVDADSPDEATNVAKQTFQRQHDISDWQLHADVVEIRLVPNSGRSLGAKGRRRSRDRG